MKLNEFCSSLRQLADWYEQHPTLPLPHELQSEMFVFLFGLDTEEVKRILREIGSFEKRYNQPSQGDFEAVKTVGSFKLKFHTSRDSVCTARVVGKRKVGRVVIPAKPREVIKAREEDIVEWDCEPILAG